MALSRSRALGGMPYSGYHRPLTATPDLYLCQVGRGTPGGEYLRRFWHPVAFLDELTDRPLRIRILGEDLVAFRDGSGQVGVLHLHCCHRGTSLEFGLVSERGLRCCYHGRLFDVDGTIIDVAGDPDAARLGREMSQGAYPVHILGPLVFAYLGPPEKKPAFPVFERFEIPGVKIIAGGPRLHFPCNWVQIKENSMDPAHTSVLHAIPAIKGVDHFAKEFGEFPEFVFARTPVGMMYLAARLLGERVWVRSTDLVMPNIHGISSIFEDGSRVKRANPPFRTIWTTPVDDENSINFTVSHMPEGDPLPAERRRYLELFGQTAERPYEERQWIPGDYDAMVSQGPIEVHDLEHLGSHDLGVSMFRRFLRQGIEAVERGEEPHDFTTSGGRVPTFCTDRVVPASEVAGDPTDRPTLRRFAQQVADEYLVSPPQASP